MGARARNRLVSTDAARPRLRGATALWLTGGVVALLLLAELATRLAGVTDFPIYAATTNTGYEVRASQSGAFLNRNRWRFNELGMGAGPFAGGGVLLVGDSIVLGGNPVDDPARLGPQLSKLSGERVWPISAGSWGLLNELAWLQAHPAVLQQVNEVVFVLNSDDFGPPSVWRSELTHPTKRPACAVCYVAAKAISSKMPRPAGSDGEASWREPLSQMLAAGKPTTIVLYPKRGQDRRELEFRARQMAEMPVRVINVAADERWRAASYRDGIHPTDQATALLAAIIDDQRRSGST